MATAKLSDKRFLSTVWVKQEDYPNTTIRDNKIGVTINYDLPFRIRFTNILIPGYGPNNVPPIGIAIVGYNNYIL